MEKRLRNIVVIEDYGSIVGGAERVAIETAVALKQEGFRVIFFCAVAPIANVMVDNQVEIVCLNQNALAQEKNRIKGVLRGINNKQAKKRFSALLDTLDPEETVVHVHSWTKALSSVLFPVAKKKGFKVAITVHEYFLVCPNGGFFNYPKKEICVLKPMSLKCVLCNCDSRSYPRKIFRVARQWKQNKDIRKCDNISYIFISEFSKREFLKRYDKIPEDKRYFLTNMIHFDEHRFRVESEKNDTYLFIGGLTEVKGIRLFCEAVTRAGVKAVAIGQGLLYEELKAQYPNVEFVGWKTKEEMLPYLQKTRCLVFPSIWYETFGLVPMENMAYGIPVICSDLNAASDYVADGENGFVYNGKSIEALVESIERSRNDEIVQKLSFNAFENFDEEKYSTQTYVKDLAQILEKVLK